MFCIPHDLYLNDIVRLKKYTAFGDLKYSCIGKLTKLDFFLHDIEIGHSCLCSSYNHQHTTTSKIPETYIFIVSPTINFINESNKNKADIFYLDLIERRIQIYHPLKSSKITSNYLQFISQQILVFRPRLKNNTNKLPDFKEVS